MSTAILMNTCTVCGAEESLDGLLLRMIDDDQVRRLIADVLTASLPLGGLVVRYLRLHKPPKQKLRMSVVGKVLAELVPDMQRGVIERTGRRWTVSHDQWRDAIQAVFDAQHKGTLSVPLQGNGYLYQVLMRLADQAEAAQEKQVDAERRSRANQGGAQPVGAVLAQLQSPASAPVPTSATAPIQAVAAAVGEGSPQPRRESNTVRAFKAQMRQRTQPTAGNNDLSTEESK